MLPDFLGQQESWKCVLGLRSSHFVATQLKEKLRRLLADTYIIFLEVRHYTPTNLVQLLKLNCHLTELLSTVPMPNAIYVFYNCNGYENSLADCFSSTPTNSQCASAEAVIIQCTSSKQIIFFVYIILNNQY